MDERTRVALEGSIKKWEEIVAGTGVDLGYNNCPLCAEFLKKNNVNEENCVGCPVRERTGKTYCSDTPYDDWSDTPYDDWSECRARKYAQAELDFLKSLRTPD